MPGASDVIGAAVVDGHFYVDHFEQIPGFDNLNRVIVAGSGAPSYKRHALYQPPGQAKAYLE
jgi:hypothetical protein